MTNIVQIRIYDIINSSVAISEEDGNKVFEKILPLLKSGMHVNISFDKIDTLISSFLSISIGQLYGYFTQSQLQDKLNVTDLDKEDSVILMRVIDNAKKYYDGKILNDIKFDLNNEDE